VEISYPPEQSPPSDVTNVIVEFQGLFQTNLEVVSHCSDVGKQVFLLHYALDLERSGACEWMAL
jgi:hypothetical protein